MLWRTAKNPTPVARITFEYFNRLLSRHAHKYPQGIPQPIRAILWACARKQTLYPELRTREHGQKLMRQRMAKAAHKAQRDKGIKPGQAGREAMKRKRAEKQLIDKGLSKQELRCGSSNLDGI